MGKRGGVEVLARAGSGEGEKGRVRLGGCNGEEEGGNEKGEMGRGQQEGGDGEGHKGEGRRRARGEGISQMDVMKCLGGMRLQFFLTLFTGATPECNGEEEGGNEKGEMGRGQQEGGDGEGHKGEGRRRARGEGISQMDMMKCLGGMRLQFFLTLFTRATPGTPAST